MKTRRRLIASGVGAAALVAGAMMPETAGAEGRSSRVVLEGLSSPKGIDIGLDGSLVVAQGAFGPPAPVIAYNPRVRPRDRVTELTEPFNLVDMAISPLDGTGWAISSADQTLYHQLADGTVVPVLNVPQYQTGDPDPVDNEGIPDESNPYGLTVMANGDALVADAAGNDLIRVTPDGDAWTAARFDREVVSTDHLPPEAGFPPELLAEAVPTTVTIGPDGAIYVGELKGFPFRPGSSRVWRIEPDAGGAWCSVNAPQPACTVYVSGLTAIQDIAFDHRRGRLYSLQLAKDGVLAFEAGFETGEFPAAQLIEIRRLGRRTEQRKDLGGGLSEPGGVAVTGAGRIYVTDGVFTQFGGRLSRIRG